MMKQQRRRAAAAGREPLMSHPVFRRRMARDGWERRGWLWWRHGGAGLRWRYRITWTAEGNYMQAHRILQRALLEEKLKKLRRGRRRTS